MCPWKLYARIGESSTVAVDEFLQVKLLSVD